MSKEEGEVNDPIEDEDSDLDVDYNAENLSDEEIEKKLLDLSMEIDASTENLSSANAEQDYLFAEKNKRYAGKKK